MAEVAGRRLRVVHCASIVFDGREHGMDLFTAHPDLMAQIIEWMNASLG
jgi:hypothetical protein